MTLLSRLGYRPPPATPVAVPRHIRADRISVVVPVKDNQAGIDRLVARFSALSVNGVVPAEIIVVDNGSAVPLRLPPPRNTPADRALRHVTCDRPGLAAARNAGAAVARGDWLLFMDSDCLPTATTVSGYLTPDNRYVAYAGGVSIPPTSILARFYAAEEILRPPVAQDGARTGPEYLVTANCLVAASAFRAVGGFDERFAQAGGEDIDLAFRLLRVGDLGANDHSQVLHPITDGLRGFWRRCRRYGQGNRQVADKYHLDLAPRPFWPRERALSSLALALLQYVALRCGYRQPPGARAGEPGGQGVAPGTPPLDAGAAICLDHASHRQRQGASVLELSAYFVRTLTLEQIERVRAWPGPVPAGVRHALELARSEQQFIRLHERAARRRTALQAQVAQRRAAGTLVPWLARLPPADRPGLGTAAERRAAQRLRQTGTAVAAARRDRDAVGEASGSRRPPRAPTPR